MTNKNDLDRAPKALVVSENPAEITFNLLAALPGRVSSRHTLRAYFRWIDQYLADMAQLSPTRGTQRIKRMENLPVQILQKCLTCSMTFF